MKTFPQKKAKEEPKKKLQKKSKIDNQKIPNKEGKGGKEQKKEKQKKIKDESIYVMKKNTGMKILRIVFWTLLIFVFARGVIQIIKPDKKSELNQIIEEFEQEQSMIGNTPDEVMLFAQDFARNYLTYQQAGEQDFKDRIKPYVSKRIYNLPEIYSFHNNAKATYVNAYRSEKKAMSGQYDVYVNAEVVYELENENVYDTCTLKIPVSISDDGYCVTSLPLYVEDKRLDETYNAAESILGIEIDSSMIMPSINNFFAAYYSQDQSMINYLLSQEADRSKFVGMNNRYTYKRVDTIKAYKKEGSEEIRCILKIKIQDTVNEEEIYQEFNMVLVQDGDKYYIKDLCTGITGIN